MSEYIGSRISLISKSDIKYVGTLHEINSDKSTVALESVVSYGTEGRKGRPSEEIPGSDQVYEYIVFRGSDVKQLEIVSPPQQQGQENERPRVPDDPAILGSARPTPANQQPPLHPHHQQQQFQHGPQQFPPPQQFGGYQHGPPPNQFPNQPRFQGPGGPHGFPGSPGAVPGYGYGPPPPGYGMPFGAPPPPPPGQGFPGQPPQGPFPPASDMNHQPPQPMQIPPGESNQAMAQPNGSQVPPPFALQQQRPAEMPAPSTSSSGPPPPMESKPSTSAATAPSAPVQAQQHHSKQQQQQPSQLPTVAKVAQKANARVAVPLPSQNTLAAKPPQKSNAPAAQQQPPPRAVPQPQSVQDATQTATAAVAAAMAKLGPVNNNKAPQQPDGVVDNLTQKVNQMRLQDGQQHFQRGRGRGRGGPFRGGRRESAQKGVDVPKEDYDFESANAKFNKQDLADKAPASASPITSPTDGETPDSVAKAAELNGHASAAAEEDDVKIPAKPSGEKRYDKKSSFFDDISSDLKDRVEQQTGEHGIDGRAMRREERSKNVETFGQGSVDGGGHRGGFRGRGRGRGQRGYGNGFRGRGGFESRVGMRGRGRGGPAEVATG